MWRRGLGGGVMRGWKGQGGRGGVIGWMGVAVS